MRRETALIVGAGPAGCAAAIALAREGTRALIVDRDPTPRDALCGGFLSWRTLRTLADLGIDAAALGGAAIDRLRLFAGSAWSEAPLPAGGIGLSRRALDTALRARAVAAGAGFAFARARHAAPGLLATDQGEIVADNLFLATGKHELRGLARPRAAAGTDPALGLRLRLPAAQAVQRLVEGAIELHLFRGGYAGLLLQEDGTANLCMAVHRSRLSEAGDPAALLRALEEECPALGQRLAAAPPAAGPIEAVAQVPYGWRARRGVAGLFRLGDQAGVIPSLAGEGIGIALASGVLAARHHQAGGAVAGVTFQHDLARRLSRPLGIAGALRALAEHPAGARAMTASVRWVPSLVGPFARWTRIDGY